MIRSYVDPRTLQFEQSHNPFRSPFTIDYSVNIKNYNIGFGYNNRYVRLSMSMLTISVNASQMESEMNLKNRLADVLDELNMDIYKMVRSGGISTPNQAYYYFTSTLDTYLFRSFGEGSSATVNSPIWGAPFVDLKTTPIKNH